MRIGDKSFVNLKEFTLFKKKITKHAETKSLPGNKILLSPAQLNIHKKTIVLSELNSIVLFSL